MTVTWYVTMRARAGEEAIVREGLARLAAPSRAVPGCLVFEVHEQPDRPGSFSIYERWADHAAHDEHTRSAHFRDYAQAMVIDHCESMESAELAPLEAS